jgi:hypothetical protein
MVSEPAAAAASSMTVRRKKNHGGYCVADFIHVVGST